MQNTFNQPRGLRNTFFSSPEEVAARQELAAEAQISDLNAFDRGLRRGLYTTPALISDTVGQFAEPFAPEFAKRRFDYSTEAYQRGNAIPLPVERADQVDGLGSALSYIAGQAGTMLPQAAVSVPAATIGALAGGLPGAAAAGFAANFPMATGEHVRAMREDPTILATTTPEQRLGEAITYGVPATALDTVGDVLFGGRVAGAARKALAGSPGQALAHVAKGVPEAALTEGAPEAAQQALSQQMLTRLNPERDTSEDMANLRESFFAGWAGGAPTSVGGRAVEVGKAAAERIPEAAESISEWFVRTKDDARTKLADMLRPSNLPPDLANASDEDVLAWDAAESERKRAAADKLAEDAINDPNTSDTLRQKAAEYWSAVKSGAADAWREFSGAVDIERGAQAAKDGAARFAEAVRDRFSNTAPDSTRPIQQNASGDFSEDDGLILNDLKKFLPRDFDQRADSKSFYLALREALINPDESLPWSALTEAFGDEARAKSAIENMHKQLVRAGMADLDSELMGKVEAGMKASLSRDNGDVETVRQFAKLEHGEIDDKTALQVAHRVRQGLRNYDKMRPADRQRFDKDLETLFGKNATTAAQMLFDSSVREEEAVVDTFEDQLSEIDAPAVTFRGSAATKSAEDAPGSMRHGGFYRLDYDKPELVEQYAKNMAAARAEAEERGASVRELNPAEYARAAGIDPKVIAKELGTTVAKLADHPARILRIEEGSFDRDPIDIRTEELDRLSEKVVDVNPGLTVDAQKAAQVREALGMKGAERFKRLRELGVPHATRVVDTPRGPVVKMNLNHGGAGRLTVVMKNGTRKVIQAEALIKRQRDAQRTSPSAKTAPAAADALQTFASAVSSLLNNPDVAGIEVNDAYGNTTFSEAGPMSKGQRRAAKYKPRSEGGEHVAKAADKLDEIMGAFGPYFELIGSRGTTAGGGSGNITTGWGDTQQVRGDRGKDDEARVAEMLDEIEGLENDAESLRDKAYELREEAYDLEAQGDRAKNKADRAFAKADKLDSEGKDDKSLLEKGDRYSQRANALYARAKELLNKADELSALADEAEAGSETIGSDRDEMLAENDYLDALTGETEREGFISTDAANEEQDARERKNPGARYFDEDTGEKLGQAPSKDKRTLTEGKMHEIEVSGYKVQVPSGLSSRDFTGEMRATLDAITKARALVPARARRSLDAATERVFRAARRHKDLRADPAQRAALKSEGKDPVAAELARANELIVGALNAGIKAEENAVRAGAMKNLVKMLGGTPTEFVGAKTEEPKTEEPKTEEPKTEEPEAEAETKVFDDAVDEVVDEVEAAAPKSELDELREALKEMAAAAKAAFARVTGLQSNAAQDVADTSIDLLRKAVQQLTKFLGKLSEAAKKLYRLMQKHIRRVREQRRDARFHADRVIAAMSAARDRAEKRIRAGDAPKVGKVEPGLLKELTALDVDMPGVTGREMDDAEKIIAEELMGALADLDLYVDFQNFIALDNAGGVKAAVNAGSSSLFVASDVLKRFMVRKEVGRAGSDVLLYRTLAHEMAHVWDVESFAPLEGKKHLKGLYSLSEANDRLALGGDLHKEASTVNRDPMRAHFYSYPLDAMNKSRAFVASELFAQALSLYYTNPAIMMQYSPKMYDFAKEAADAIARKDREAFRRVVSGVQEGVDTAAAGTGNVSASNGRADSRNGKGDQGRQAEPSDRGAKQAAGSNDKKLSAANLSASRLPKTRAQAESGLKKLFNKLVDLVVTAQNTLIDSGNPALEKLGRVFSNETGAKDKDLGFLAARVQQSNIYLNKLIGALEGYEKITINAAVRGLQTGDLAAADTKVREVQDKLRALLEELFDYVGAAGVDIKHRKNYFPRTWNPTEIVARRAEFIRLLKDDHLASTGRRLSDEKANAIAEVLILNRGAEPVQESEYHVGFTPFMRAVNRRTLDFIKSPAFADFQQSDAVEIMSTYISHAVHRAEYDKRFGAKGAKLREMLGEAFKHEIDTRVGAGTWQRAYDKAFADEEALAKKEGRAPDPARVTIDKIASKIRGQKDALREAEAVLKRARRAVMAMEGTLGSTAYSNANRLKETLRRLTPAAIVYENVRLLTMSLFSQFIDPLGVMVRGGSSKDAFNAYVRGLKEVMNAWRGTKAEDSMSDLARKLGVIDASGVLNTMGNMYSSVNLDGRVRKINDALFRWNGVEGFTQGVRVGATEAAINFIKFHGTVGDQHSTRYLQELGLEASDVTLDAEGNLDYDNPKIRDAIFRWVDGAVVRPNAALRPSWASDPHFTLFFHMKQFTYAFHKVILERMLGEAKNSNYAPIGVALAAYIPVMVAADVVRGFIGNGGEEPPWMRGADAGDILLRGVQRAGLLGIPQFGVDAVEWGPLDLAGPAVEHAAETVANLSGGDFNQAWREALPAVNVIRDALS